MGAGAYIKLRDWKQRTFADSSVHRARRAGPGRGAARCRVLAR